MRRAGFAVLSLLAISASTIVWYNVQQLHAKLHDQQMMIAGMRSQTSLIPKAPSLSLDRNLAEEELNPTDIPAHAATEQVPDAVVSSWQDVDKRIRNTVVQIFSFVTQFNWLEPYKTPDQMMATGTGFFIDNTGLILTNAHVVNQAISLSIQIPSLGKQRYDVEILGISPERDLALLRLKESDRQEIVRELGKIPYLTFGDSDGVHRADQVMALGYPLGQQSLKSTTGVVSGVEHIGGRSMIQISAPINPGNSGGPCLNDKGVVIGVNTAGIFENGTQNVGYIIPANEVKLFLKQLEHAEPTASGVKLLRKPYLGILYHGATEILVRYLKNPSPGGAYVVETLQGSALHEADVRTGDMLYSIDGLPIDRFGEMNVSWSEDKISLIDYVSRLMVGDSVTLGVYRNGVKRDVTIPIDTKHLPAVRVMYPAYEPIEYEVLAGAVVMQLTLNHVATLMNQNERLAQYADPRKQIEPVLIISHILPDSLMSRARTISAGSLIDEVNGQKVRTLDEFRSAVRLGAPSGYMTIKTKEKELLAFQLARVFDEEQRLSRMFFYEPSSLITELKDITPRV